MATPIYLQQRARRGPTFRETLLMHAVGRIAYRGAIDNIQVSWVKMGADGVRQLLRAGVNDLGRHADGREHLPGRRGQPRADDGRRRVPRPSSSRSGGTLVQRTTLYGRVPTPPGHEPVRTRASLGPSPPRGEVDRRPGPPVLTARAIGDAFERLAEELIRGAVVERPRRDLYRFDARPP